MLCLISLVFIFLIISQLENGNISYIQAMIYGSYGLLMFYHTSKPYWDYNNNVSKYQKRGGKHGINK